MRRLALTVDRVGGPARVAGLLLAACVAGCGEPPATPDAGVSEGGTPIDPAGPLPTCASPLVLEGVEDRTVIAELDTLGGLDGAIDLGDCGPTDARPPQGVIAYRVPGTGDHAVTVSTINNGTDRTFDTVLAVRRGSCGAFPATTSQLCFDDQGSDRRSRGTLLAQGGETVYVIASGWESEGAVDRGPMRVEITARVNHPPAIESGSVLVTPAGVRVEVRGSDEDADGWGVLVTFHGPARELLDTDGDGDADYADGLVGAFDRSVTGALEWRETATLPMPEGAIGGATEAWIRILDEPRAYSATDLAVPVRTGLEVGSGEACSPTRVCAIELECRDLTCQATPERAALCAAATPIVIETPTVGATSASAEGVLMPGDGSFTGSCASTVGRELVYRVDVPAGRFDVLATTDVPGTSTDVDTVIYARASCVDPASAPEEWCNDDIDLANNRRSDLELLDVPEGPLALFVEHWAGVPADRTARIETEVTLRPVLDTGATCDPQGALNRCASGACPAATRACP